MSACAGKSQVYYLSHVRRILMDNAVSKVFSGYLKLSDAQKNEFREIVNKFEKGGPLDQYTLRESVRASVTKMQTGPHDVSCPCCGR
jgi:hypothetical protein